MLCLSSSTILRIVDSVAIVLGQAYQLARVRMASMPSPVLRAIAHRDHAVMELELLRRELAVMRAQRANLAPHRRPDYARQQRLAILQIMRLRSWNAKQAADRFVLHPNTIRAWIKVIEGRTDSCSLLGDLPWNKIHETVRWAVHELRRMFPEPEFGTRTIARHLIRAGVAISRTTVQRVIREPRPVRPYRLRQSMSPAAGVEPRHLLKPQRPNEVWQLDLLSLRILWLRFTVAAVLDGCTRHLLQLKVYKGAANSRQMIDLVRRTVVEFGSPNFMITDHGTQFRKRFRGAVEGLGITHVKGRVRSPMFNGKVERLFKTLRQWQRLTLLPITLVGIQRRLDCFREWYNTYRPHQALVQLTPGEAARACKPPRPVPIRAREKLEPQISVMRLKYRGDPCLPVVRIEVQLSSAA